MSIAPENCLRAGLEVLYKAAVAARMKLVRSGQSDEFTVLSALRGLPLYDDIYNRVDTLDDAKYLAEQQH